jgi:transcriptional regulator with GAF, ATPase, and Fis domain
MSQVKSNCNYPNVIEQLITSIGQETDKKKVLGLILPCALAISGSEVGALLVTDDEHKKLRAVVRQGLPGEVIEQLTSGDLANLLLIGQRLWVKSRRLRRNSKQALLGRHGLHYLFGVPFRFAGQVLGAVVVGSHTASDNCLGQEQQRRLELLTQLVALFLDDIRLRTKELQVSNASNGSEAQQPDQADTPQPDSSVENSSVSTPPQVVQTAAADDLEQLLAAVMSAEEEVASQNSDLGLLDAISNEVGSSLHLNRVLDAAIKQTQAALKTEAGWCYLFKDGVLVLSQYQGLSSRYVEAMHQLELGNGAEGMAFSRSEPIMRDGLLFHSGRTRRLVQEEGLRSIAAIPLTAGNEPFGVLAVGSHFQREWSSRDQRMLLSIGQKVAQAITNSQMFSEAERKAQEWEANYSHMQQTNAQLTARANALAREVQELRRIEQQIWIALAASQKASKSQGEGLELNQENLVATLKKALTALRQEQGRALSVSACKE